MGDRKLKYVAILFALSSLRLTCADEEASQVQIILFVPPDIDVPQRYQERLNETISYADHFFQSGFERWGHNSYVSPFRYDDRGNAEVLIIRGKNPASSYKNASLRKEAIELAGKNFLLPSSRQAWWIFVYLGDPPNKFSTYRGGFDASAGGWSVCNYDSRPGTIDVSDPLGSPFLTELTLKGMIHELGHAFQLPHIGPRIKDDAGNTLMGPTHFNFKRVTGRHEESGYLSEASAAMLVHQPAFRGVKDDRKQLPTVKTSRQHYEFDREGSSIQVSGNIKSSGTPKFAIVADESTARPGDYWTKHYVGAVQDSGDYDVTVSEPSPASGKLRVWFVFENGAMTGNGRLRSNHGAIEKEYHFDPRSKAIRFD